MTKNVLIIMLSVFVLSCNSDDDNSEMVTIESTLIAKDNLSGSGDEGIIEQNLVITNQSSWNDLIAQMDSVNIISDNFSEIDIDFSEFIIIAVFDEIKGNGGYTIEIDVMANLENIIVTITNIAPQGNATTVITQPFHIVKIPNLDLPILFE